MFNTAFVVMEDGQKVSRKKVPLRELTCKVVSWAELYKSVPEKAFTLQATRGRESDNSSKVRKKS